MKNWMFLLSVLILTNGCASAGTKYIRSHPGLKPEVVQAISGKTITHGMTKEQVLLSVGAPEKTHGYVKDGRLIELWIYSEFRWLRFEEIMFDNGIVVGWNIPDSIKRTLDKEAPTDLVEGTPLSSGLEAKSVEALPENSVSAVKPEKNKKEENKKEEIEKE